MKAVAGGQQIYILGINLSHRQSISISEDPGHLTPTARVTEMWKTQLDGSSARSIYTTTRDVVPPTLHSVNSRTKYAFLMHFHNCPSLSGNFGSWDGTAGYSLGICSPQMCRRCHLVPSELAW